MASIRYQFCDGTVSEVEVDEELYAVSADIDRRIANGDRRETRRHESFDGLAKRLDTEIADGRVNIETDYIDGEEIATLRAALKTLTPEQRELVRKIFYEGRALKAVAAEYGVSSPAIISRLNKIYARLKKSFASGG
jgi:RNA polymerase sigma-70 factor (ECF subfamily)